MVIKRRDEGATSIFLVQVPLSVFRWKPTLEFLFLPEFLLARNILVVLHISVLIFNRKMYLSKPSRSLLSVVDESVPPVNKYTTQIKQWLIDDIPQYEYAEDL